MKFNYAVDFESNNIGYQDAIIRIQDNKLIINNLKYSESKKEPQK